MSDPVVNLRIQNKVPRFTMLMIRCEYLVPDSQLAHLFPHPVQPTRHCVLTGYSFCRLLRYGKIEILTLFLLVIDEDRIGRVARCANLVSSLLRVEVIFVNPYPGTLCVTIILLPPPVRSAF